LSCRGNNAGSITSNQATLLANVGEFEATTAMLITPRVELGKGNPSFVLPLLSQWTTMMILSTILAMSSMQRKDISMITTITTTQMNGQMTWDDLMEWDATSTYNKSVDREEAGLLDDAWGWHAVLAAE
jgi:hypothetical protein